MNSRLSEALSIFMAEVMASMFFIFFGCMSLVTGFTKQPLTIMQAGFAFAFLISSIIVAFVHISGAHLNPAITAATIVLGLVKPEMAIVYFLGDIVGGCIGFQLLSFVTPKDILYYGVDKSFGFCTIIPNPLLSIPQALFMEFICTFFLLCMVCGAFDPKSGAQRDTLPVKFSFAIIGIVLTAGQYGVSMNPIRAMIPAIFNGVWTRQWIYWIGPISAGFVTPVVYKFLFQRDPGPNKIGLA